MKALQQMLYSPTAKSFEWELKRPASTEKQITAAVNWILSDVQQSPEWMKNCTDIHSVVLKSLGG